MVSLHTRFRAFPPQRPAQQLLLPSLMHNMRTASAQSFVLRRFHPVAFFVYPAWRLFERALFLRVRVRRLHALKPGSARICPPYHVSAQSILGAKVLPRSLEDLSVKQMQDFSFLCEGTKSCPEFCGGV
jgi:hypothetical protein